MKIYPLGLLAGVLLLLASASPSAAQTASNLSVRDANGTTRTLCETLDGSGNLTPCVQSGAATAAAQAAQTTAIQALPQAGSTQVVLAKPRMGRLRSTRPSTSPDGMAAG